MTSKIEITEKDRENFIVKVQGKSTTTHIVMVTDSHQQNLTNGNMTKEELLRFSFLFLLEREPNTSILSEFKIDVIGHYFPEYKRKIQEIIKN
tara:strand:- start:46 stop:324 length:279 start_codon:yes stop_codon:yes gene_type:complete